ncbi:MAG: hypothetical protein E7311_07345 [Clostridiales bacterium]|nr:hypothetical protein [Clostridiales bacterium]
MVENICSRITNYLRSKVDMSDERAEVINFGLLVLLGEVPKIILIMLFAWYFNILKLTLITFIAMSIYRTQAGGFHLDGHISCFLFSLIVFCGTSFLAKAIVTTNVTLLYILYGLIFVLDMIVIHKYAPADTDKIPIISSKKRKEKKIKSYIAVMIIYLFAIFISNSQIISNICVLTTLIQSLGMTPLAYKISKCEYGEVSKIEYDII